ncbi:MAG: site-specific integrase [Alphaproteobacteria bacterium]|nr:site-specific integrase [Alphaproteobacteria bacterium]
MSKDDDIYKLWQHPNGLWYVTWTEPADSTLGKRARSPRVSTATTDRKIAEQYRAQFIAELKNVPLPDDPIINILLDRYRDEHAVNTRSLPTIDFHIKTLKPFFGNLQPRHVTNNLLKEYAGVRGVSPGTILRELGTLKAALHYAEGNRWINEQPRFIMPVSQPPPRDLWLTYEQVATLIEAAKSEHLRLFIQIAVCTAARSGAILDLTWEQVNLETRLIDFGRGWGNKRRAIVPINDELHAALTRAAELRQSAYVIEYHGEKVKSVKSAFRRLCKDQGIKASPHVLRHTAATWLVMAKVPLAEVARLLGDSEKTVEKVYGKHAPDYLRNAVNSLGFGRPKPGILQL